MPVDAAHNKWWQVTEVVFGIPFLASIALQLLTPIPLPGKLRLALIITGAVLIGAGMAFIILTRREMARFGQRTDPGHPTHQIVTSGVFSISRNPLYLGAASLFLGISMVAALAWFFILFLPTLVACHYILIAPEERYLRVKFGEEYTRYAVLVRRWIGRSGIPSRQ